MKSHLLLCADPISEGRDHDVLCEKQVKNAVCAMRFGGFSGDFIPDFAAISTLQLCQKCVRKLLHIQVKPQEILYLYALLSGQDMKHEEEVV